DAVPCDHPPFHRLDEVSALFFRLLDRVGPDECASTDRGVIELPRLSSVRSDGVDVTSRAQPITMDGGLGRVRRGDGNVGLADRLFGRFRHFDVYPEDGGHLLREGFAMRLVSTEASEAPNGADRADRLQLALC